MNITEVAIIALLIVNILMLILTGRAIIAQITNESENLALSLANLLTEQLPEAISNAAEELGGLERANPLQQMAVEWMRNMMNQPTINANVTEIPRSEDGKFEKLADRS